MRQGANKREVYLCAESYCTHSLPAQEAEGKDTICWHCNKVCKVPKGRPGRRVVRPHCFTCTKQYKRSVAAGAQPIDMEKLANMSIDDLLNDTDLFDLKKDKE